ncbi:MAG: ATP-dependent metallopeptidase FtsH/Yme1/Tma family protein, partial [Pirellulaceae bacterium]
MALILLSAFAIYGLMNANPISHVPYSVFETQIDERNIQTINIRDDSADGLFKLEPEKVATYDPTTGSPRPSRKKAGEKETYSKQFYVELPTDTQSRSQLLERMRQLKAEDPEFVYDVIPGSIANQIYWMLYIGLGIAAVALMWT